MTGAKHQVPGDIAGASADFVVVDGVVKHFPVRVGAWRKGSVRSLDGVSFGIRRGEIMGLVGESGCGKSTLARVLLRLIPPDSGSVTVAGRDLASLHGEELRRFRTSMQLIFQNPYAALDPRMRIGTSLVAPLAQHGIGTHQERLRRVSDIVEGGRTRRFLRRAPAATVLGRRASAHRHRACAAAQAQVSWLCDEPTSALDASLRAQVVNLLVDLKRRFDLTLLLISHDLRVVRHV